MVSRPVKRGGGRLACRSVRRAARASARFCCGVRVSSNSPLNMSCCNGISLLIKVKTGRDHLQYRCRLSHVLADNSQAQFPEPSSSFLEERPLPYSLSAQCPTQQALRSPVPSRVGNTISLLWQQNWSEMIEVHFQSLLVSPSDGF